MQMKTSVYGFINSVDRFLFLKITSVKGLGPKAALNIMSVYSEADLRHLIRQGDVRSMLAIKGVGAKTAEKIILELTDWAKSDGSKAPSLIAADSRREDVVLALESMGFQKKAFVPILDALWPDVSPKDDTSSILSRAIKAIHSSK